MAGEWVALWEGLKWIAGKVGGAYIGAKGKEAVDTLTGAKKEAEKLTQEIAKLNREIGELSANSKQLIEELDFKQAQLDHQIGRASALGDLCAANGVVVPPNFFPPAPARASVLQKAKNPKK